MTSDSVGAGAPGRRLAWFAAGARAVLAWQRRNRTAIRVSLWLTLASKALAFTVALAWGRSTLASFCLWDCNWYERILSGGYHWDPLTHVGRDAASWAFFPLLPLLAWPLHGLAGLSGETALVLTGTLLLPVCIYLFLALVEAHGIRVGPWSAGCLLAFNPYAIYAHAGYTEPLYFALAAGTLLALQRDRWAAAGLLGCAAATTRLVGLFLVLPMVERWLRKARQPRPAGSGPLDPVLAIALVPLGVALFGWHLRESTGDLLAFVHIQIAWGRLADNPLVVWWIAASGSGRTRFFAATTALGLAAALALLRRGRLGDGLFLAAAILVPLQSGIGSMPRFVFWQPPFLLVLATLMQRPRWRRALLILFAAGSAVIDVAWFSGDNFVN